MENEINQIIKNKTSMIPEHLDIEMFKELVDLTKSSLFNMRDSLNILNVISEELENREQANAYDTLMKTLFVYQSRLDQHKTKIKIDMDETLETSIGSTLLEMIYDNLLENAIKHGIDGSINNQICIRGYQIPDHVVIEMTDNGKGIPEKEINHVFDPYYSGCNRANHTGKGLTFIYDVLSRFNSGDISLKSKEGCYTKVVVRLRM